MNSFGRQYLPVPPYFFMSGQGSGKTGSAIPPLVAQKKSNCPVNFGGMSLIDFGCNKFFRRGGLYV